MSTNNSPRPRGIPFRPASITQFPEPTGHALRARRAHALAAHDTVPGRNAREWFSYLRPALLASRPILNQGAKKKVRAITAKGTVTRTVPAAPIYGKPTFRNVIENGQHV